VPPEPSPSTDRTGVVEVRLPDGTDGWPARLIAAAALTVGCYERADSPVLGLMTDPWDGGSALRLNIADVRLADLLTDAGAKLGGIAGDSPPPPEDTGGVMLGIRFDAPGAASAPWPITLVPQEADRGLLLEVRHRTEEFDAEAACRFARHLAHVYSQMHGAGARMLAHDVEILDEEETRRQLAVGVPSARAEPWAERRIDAAFEMTAARYPEAVALVCDGHPLTYRELDERAGRFAAGLRVLGAVPEERVGVCLERSTDLVVVLLAVLKAGAVYVPMDPAHPADRLAYTVQDASLRLVVTDVDDFPEREGLRTVRPDGLGEAAHATGPIELGHAAGEAAYVIYTSGSTGRPKGVVVSHANVLALLAGTRKDFGLGPDDTWTLFHSAAFDVSVWEMWGALLTGGRLVVVPYWISRSPEDFRALLAAENVTVLGQTPSAFPQFLEADRRQEERLAVRLLIFAGEPLDTRTLLGWFDRYPEDRCRVVNMFGITETTVHSTVQTVTRAAALAGSRSVGRPIPGWTVRVLDARGRPIPTGAIGEIYVGGAGVAMGYLERPELTAERFLLDPFDGGRIYRSGDLGRFLPGGDIEHLGRLDHQVKIRGFRIELDEIRNVLLADPAIVAAAVVVGGGRDGDAARVRLDAYVVLDDHHGDHWAADLRARAARLLPDYMVPATMTALPELPLTVNGKLDARRLPEPAFAPPRPDPARSGPEVVGSAELAGELASAWESVLGIPVGLDDEFFALGGNSLLAVQVRAVLRERGLPALNLSQLYRTRTPRRLAAAMASPT